MNSEDLGGWASLSGLPTLEVGLVEEEPRRSEAREEPVTPLVYLDDDWTPHRLRLSVCRETLDGSREETAELLDCSDTGMAVTGKRAARCGEHISVVAEDADDGEALFREPFTICNARRQRLAPPTGGKASSSDPAHGSSHIEYTFGVTVDKSMVNEPDRPDRYVFGLKLEEGEHSRVYKAFFDTLLLEYLGSEAGDDLEKVLVQLKQASAQGGP